MVSLPTSAERAVGRVVSPPTGVASAAASASTRANATKGASGRQGGDITINVDVHGGANAQETGQEVAKAVSILLRQYRAELAAAA
jgi:hypothetical protein